MLVAVLWSVAVMPAQQQPSVTFLGQLNQYAFEGYNDVWGYQAPDGKEYALLGVTTGTSVIDVSDPANLREISFIPSTPSSWKDLKSYRNYAYVVTEHGPGLQVIDLSALPDSAHLVRTITSFMGTSFSTSHNLYVDTARALLYMEGTGSQPVRLWSLADPAQPVGLSAFGPVGSQIHDIYARGNKAYVSEGTGGNFGVYDVTNPASPVLLKRFTSPSGGYAHNAWLSDDGNFLLTTEETVGRTIKYWNIANLDAVELRGQYLGSTQLAHNVHIKGMYAYVSHYKGGLKILDLSNSVAIAEVASYDTYIPDPTSTYPYEGAWGAYPFFSSGKILISDMQRGLFVVHFQPAVVTHADEEHVSLPRRFSLSQNYPNPFNPATTITFELPEHSFVRLSVHDMIGREVAVLASREYAAGYHTITWDAGTQASGSYIYSLQTPAGQLSRLMVLAR